MARVTSMMLFARRNDPAAVKVRPTRTGGRGPQFRGVAAARVASCQLFELFVVVTRVAQLWSDFFETGVNSKIETEIGEQRNRRHFQLVCGLDAPAHHAIEFL